MSPPERREASFVCRLVTKPIVSCHTDTSRLSGGDLFIIALYHLGMVPGILDLKGEGKPWIFMTFSGGSKMEKNMKIQDEHGQMLVSGALDPRKMIS